MEPGVNPIVSYMKALPRANEPGTKFNYNTGETDLVGILVSNAVGKSLSQYASEKLWQAYGMERDAIWMVDLAGHERGGCCMSMTLGDYARVGQFMLDGGVARGQQILPDGWIAAGDDGADHQRRAAGGYGYFWWMGQGGAYQASGIFGQSITIVPDERLVIVINSAWPTATGRELFVARSPSSMPFGRRRRASEASDHVLPDRARPRALMSARGRARSGRLLKAHVYLRTSSITLPSLGRLPGLANSTLPPTLQTVRMVPSIAFSRSARRLTAPRP